MTRLVHFEFPAEDTGRAKHFWSSLFGWYARCRDTEGNPFSLFQSDESVAPPG